jgi:hypothetical protein
MTGSPGRPAAAGQHSPATPALLPSGYLLAALALLVLAPPALLGWLAGAWVVRCGCVSRGRLASAGGVTGTLVLLLIGPRVATGLWPPRGCRGHTQHRPAGHLDRRRRAGGLRAQSCSAGSDWPPSLCRPAWRSPPSHPARAWPCARSGSRPSGPGACGPRATGAGSNATPPGRGSDPASPALAVSLGGAKAAPGLTRTPPKTAGGGKPLLALAVSG